MDDPNGKTPFLARIPHRDLTGDEPLLGTEGKTVLDFWRWAHCDIVENVQRGIFAEFLVASALGITHVVRIGWAGYDLDYDGSKIEVKSSSYLQSWLQRKLTAPQFTIGARKQWIEETGEFQDPRYVADCYVFCLYEDTDGPTADILDLTRWRFYVVGISDLIQQCGKARTLPLERLEGFSTPVRFSNLKDRIDDVLAGSSFVPDVAKFPEPASKPNQEVKPAVRAYLVAKRKTRENPVIVNASNYKDAHLFARIDPIIASFGENVSAFALSGVKLNEALEAGATDLRNAKPKRPRNRWSDELLRQLKEDYEKLGTLDAVGKKHGLTRQWIQQLFVLAERRGLYAQPQKRHVARTTLDGGVSLLQETENIPVT